MSLFKEYCFRRSLTVDETIQQVCDQLRDVSSSSEEKIISLGNQLMSFSSNTEKLAEQCNTVVDVVAGEVMQSTLEFNSDKLKGMHQLVTEIKIDFDWTLDFLSHLQSKITEVKGPLEGFGRKTMMLNNLGVTTRTCIAHLGSDGDVGINFSSFADSMGRLVQQISEHSASILVRMEPLNKTAAETHHELVQLQNGSFETLVLVIKKTIDHFENFTSRQDEFNERGARLATYFKEISSNVMEVVVSLQFHDILRQRIEHVCEALEELCSDGGGRQRGHRHRDEYLRIADVCSLQIKQLEQAYAEFDGAVMGALASLEKIGGKARQVLVEVCAMEEVCEELKALINGLGSEMSFVSTYRDANKALVIRLDSVKSAVRKIFEAVVFMGTIDREMRMMGLNATIKAVHIGDDGAALVALSSEIQRCAVEISHSGICVTNIMKQVIERFEVLEKSRSGKEDIVYQICNEFQEQAESIAAITSSIEGPMGQLKDIGESLPVELQRVAENRQFLDAAQSSVHHITAILTGLIKQVLEAAEHKRFWFGIRRSPEHLQDLISKYTVHAERQVYFDHLEKNQSSTLLNDPSTAELLEQQKEEQLASSNEDVELWGDDPSALPNENLEPLEEVNSVGVDLHPIPAHETQEWDDLDPDSFAERPLPLEKEEKQDPELLIPFDEPKEGDEIELDDNCELF